MIDIITGKTQLLGLIGNPVEHSISPQLHNTLYSQFKLNMVYLPFRVTSQDLPKVIEAFRCLEIKGFNVTIPHKVEIIKQLDAVSEEALLIGAVNTVHIKEGKLHGYNTDGQGFVRSLRDSGFSIKGVKAVILGAGGAARAVAVKLAHEGAKQIVLLNRTLDKAKALSELINSKVKDVSIYDEMITGNVKKYTCDCDIIVNTTPIGMWPELHKNPVDTQEAFRNRPFVYDLIYNPTKTKLLRMAEENSCKTLNGLGMLVYQGVSAFEIWNKVNVPDSTTKKIVDQFNEYFAHNAGI